MEFNTAAESKTEIFEALRLDPGQAPIRFLEGNYYLELEKLIN